MSLWAKAQKLSHEGLQQIQTIYGPHFPIEVRHFLANWLEEKMWADLDTEGPQRDAYCKELFNSLISELEERANALISTPDLLLARMSLKRAAGEFQSKYHSNPRQLFGIIQHCLNSELELVRQFESGALPCAGPGAMLSFMPDPASELGKELHYLRERTQVTSDELRSLEMEQQAYALQYHEATKINAQLQHLMAQPRTPQVMDLQERLTHSKNSMDQSLQQKVLSLVQARMALVDNLKESVAFLAKSQRQVLDEELINWKREQQLAGNGAVMMSNLDKIQDWCENLAELIWTNRQQVKELIDLKKSLPLNPQGTMDILPQLDSHITTLLSSLVTSTFIIEKQPPQVMKTNTRFTSTVRLLVGGKLNVHMSSPQVDVTIISEAQANALLQNDRANGVGGPCKNDVSGEILNNTGRMDYVSQTRQLSVQFRNMQLKKIKRAEKKGTESVMDEKFSLFFQTKFSIGGGELQFQVWTLSLPVVVIVHGNQEPHAWATVTWDNAFAEPGRTPFAVPDRVPWPKVAETLNTKFLSSTGRGLTPDNLHFLCEKAFRITVAGDTSNMFLTWSLFCKEPLPDRTFTFWEWFYAIMKLTKEHLKGPWADGSIIGFIRKGQAEEVLAGKQPGTFLLRFSDSEPGGVTIAWVGDNQEVFMLAPFTSKDFAIRSMADRISDLQELVYLHPDIPKDQVYSKYYSPPVIKKEGGYVTPALKVTVPGIAGSYSTPGTPPMHPPLTPDHGDMGVDYFQEVIFPDDMEGLDYKFLVDGLMEPNNLQ